MSLFFFHQEGMECCYSLDCCGCVDSSRGCHYLHQDKATCDTTPFLHSCRIYRPNTQVASDIILCCSCGIL